jgi:hypothetical protein
LGKATNAIPVKGDTFIIKAALAIGITSLVVILAVALGVGLGLNSGTPRNNYTFIMFLTNFAIKFFFILKKIKQIQRTMETLVHKIQIAQLGI